VRLAALDLRDISVVDLFLSVPDPVILGFHVFHLNLRVFSLSANVTLLCKFRLIRVLSEQWNSCRSLFRISELLSR